MPMRIAIAAALCACASSAPMPDRSVAAAPAVAVPEDGSKLLFAGNAEGVQIYGCTGGEWKLKAPEAQVTGAAGEKVHHYGGPTWEAADGSKITAEVKAKAQVDAAAIPWLLLGVKSASGEGVLAKARWIQRVDTRGGTAPAGGCAPDAEVRVNYTAVYRIWGA